jgi:hypothetical protein
MGGDWTAIADWLRHSTATAETRRGSYTELTNGAATREYLEMS